MKQVNNALWKTRKLCLLCSYSQLDKHVSRLAVSAINDDRRCWSGRDRRCFGRTESPASKLLGKSRPRHTMSLVLPGHFAPASVSSMEREGQEVNGPGSERARVLLTDSLLAANWPGRGNGNLRNAKMRKGILRNDMRNAL